MSAPPHSQYLHVPHKDNYRYVTLSHCWGKPKSVLGQLKLTSKTEESFKKDGIELRELPKTYRDALLFACRLDKVGYMWIDSLCIKQRMSDSATKKQGGAEEDWLEQSRVMDKIYRNSFLNISATAATDSRQGLFFERRPEYLWEDEINVNYTVSSLGGITQTSSTKEDSLTRCTLVDCSFWDDLVSHAPVNSRAWVLQERLMAPRVLHFCRDQIAWECREFEDAEGHPELNLTTIKARQGDVVDESRLKDLREEAGLALRNSRLKGLADPDNGMKYLYVFELWKRIVEIYSRTHLTVPSDKLIALAGIARLFHEEHFCKSNEYIAGMWSTCLESQLLWQVNEDYRDGVFENPARRDATRAPSFSWASIDTPYGITYGDATDYGQGDGDPVQNPGRSSDGGISSPSAELLFKVVDHNITISDKQNAFGMVDVGGMLLLRPHFLRPIKLNRLEPAHRVPYSWYLADTDDPAEHSNLYLDTPEADVDIFKADAELFILPAAYGERTAHKWDRYLFCLLLKLEKRDSVAAASFKKLGGPGFLSSYRRIGITKLSNYADGDGQNDLKSKRSDELMCLK